MYVCYVRFEHVSNIYATYIYITGNVGNRAMLNKLLNFDIARYFWAMLTISSTFRSNFIRVHRTNSFGLAIL